MTTRTTHSTIHFNAPFALRGLDEIQPAGDYDIDMDEEMIDGVSWLAYRCIATYIHLPSRASTQQQRQLVMIDNHELQAALRLDRENSR